MCRQKLRNEVPAAGKPALSCHPWLVCKRPNLAFREWTVVPYQVLCCIGESPVGPKHFQNKARREWWSIHIEAWQRSGVSQAEYCRQFRFDEKTFTRWLQHLAGEEAAGKLVAYQTELRREKRREEREKGLKRRQRQRNSVSTDVRNRGTQAFWAMHVEAMNWSGMGVREYAAALRLSPYALRKWRDRIENAEVEIDWRAHLHPSACPQTSTGVGRKLRTVDHGVTVRLTDLLGVFTRFVSIHADIAAVLVFASSGMMRPFPCASLLAYNNCAGL